MNPPSEDMKDVLVNDLGLSFGTDLFIDRFPTNTNNCVVLRDTPGQGDLFTINGPTDPEYERPSLQVLVRNTDYRNAYQKVENVKNALLGRQGEVRNGAKYGHIQMISGIARLGRDENDRLRLSVNFSLQRKPTT